ncbi:Alpha/Beta hydrolase protein [Amylocystis lapponica]|nr:Alpha/Beta hydrolase protein [Amylocystis lapponica]
MIGRSLPEYIFIRTCICGLRLVAPASIGYVLASLHAGKFLFSPWLGAYALTEAAFYLLVYLPRGRYLQKKAIHPPLLPRAEREALFARCFSLISKADMAAGWFLSQSISSIKRDNMVEWLLWSLFGTEMEGLHEDWQEEIEGYLAALETSTGHKIEYGRNAGTKCMKVSLDPVITVHRPLLWYTIVAMVDTITCLTLKLKGFTHYTTGNILSCFPPRPTAIFSKRSPDSNIVYWYRPHRSETKLPILFIHGIGIGLWPYLPFFSELITTDPDVGIIAIENLAISMRIYDPPLTREAMLAAITRILDHHGLSRVVVVAHSYGTITAAHMLHDEALAPRVAASLLVDPIPFLLYFPAVAYNFVYRTPRTANEWQLWYFASRDPDISRTLARHFFWAQNVLWKDDLAGRRVGVVLSGRDQIVDAPAVWTYLTEEDEKRFRWQKDGLDVLYYEGIDHAQVFDSKDKRKPLIDMVSSFVRISQDEE